MTWIGEEEKKWITKAIITAKMLKKAKIPVFEPFLKATWRLFAGRFELELDFEWWKLYEWKDCDKKLILETASFADILAYFKKRYKRLIKDWEEGGNDFYPEDRYEEE